MSSLRGRKTLIVFASDYVRSTIGFITMFFVSRIMGAEQIGIVGYHLGLLGLFSIFLDLGISTAHIKRVSEKKDLGECVGTYLALKVGALSLYSIAVLTYLCAHHPLAIKDIGNQNHGVFFVLFVYYVFDQLTTVLITTFSGREEFIKLNIPTSVGRIIKLFVAITFGYLGWGAKGLAIAYLADAFTSFLAAIFLFWYGKIPIKKPTSRMLQSYIRYALPMMVIIPISVFNSNIDRVMIQKFSTLQQVGFYFTVQSLFVIINSISSSAMVVLLPKISSDFIQNKLEDLNRSVQKATRYLSIIILPVAIIVFIEADRIVGICFGVKFLGAANILRVFSIVSLVMAVSRPYSNVLYGIESHNKIAFVSFLNLIILFTCNYLLIPKLGAVGAAVSNLIVWIFSASIQIYLACRYTHSVFNF